MNAGAFLADIAELLETAEVPFMVAGSFASSVHGEARSTHDLDVVVELRIGDLQRLLVPIRSRG